MASAHHVDICIYIEFADRLCDFDGFDWDDGNRDKCRKHLVSLADIEALFYGELRIGPDKRHSGDEQRFRAIGRMAADRSIFVVFTFREGGGLKLIRPISARYTHHKEIEAYEKAIS